MPPDSTRRFSDRADDYARWRPTYPREILDLLRRTAGLVPSAVVADIGSGTGIFSRLLLEAGHVVHGVEPNAEMRREAERRLVAFPDFHSVDGTAEATGLETRSVDLVVAAQAFHWFRVEEARHEFRRILFPDCCVVLLWNRRRTRGSAFLRDYEELLLRFGTDYREVDHRQAAEPQRLEGFFGHDRYASSVFPNVQPLDREGLRGRLLSSSYVPGPDHPEYQPMLHALDVLFEASQRDGLVRIEYDTEVYHGTLAP